MLNFNKIYFKLSQKHKFHLVDQSPLPFFSSMFSFFSLFGIVLYWHNLPFYKFFIIIGFSGLMTTFFRWVFAVVVESGKGHHTAVVQHGLRLGMILFIVSEVLFFFAFFWAYFHSSLSPSIMIGAVWPPKGIPELDTWGLPLVNTFVLLSSGAMVNLAHNEILKKSIYTHHHYFSRYLFCSIMYGIMFLSHQFIEYKYALPFNWTQTIYGTTFFITTGFHGFHVTIGTLFLIYCFLREIITISPKYRYNTRLYKLIINKVKNLIFNLTLTKKQRNYFSNKIKSQTIVDKTLSNFAFTKYQHIGFEAAAWYWHFVDVVWLFLFISIYWWGNSADSITSFKYFIYDIYYYFGYRICTFLFHKKKKKESSL